MGVKHELPMTLLKEGRSRKLVAQICRRVAMDRSKSTLSDKSM